MKTKLFLICIMVLCMPLSLYAHDFEVGGIYYNITSETDKTVAVTFRGDYYYDYDNEYTGTVVIPESVVTYNGTNYSVTSIDRAFLDCTGLKEVTIPNSVTSIGDLAFSGCSGLTEVTIPNSVTSIGDYAFSNCSGLKEITIPNSVTSIGEGAFWGCTGLTAITIPEGVTSIGDYAFNNCTGLTEITIPNSVTSIGVGAFRGCSGLTEVTIGNSVTSIGKSAFDGCSGLRTVTIGSSVQEIGENAFAVCDRIKTVNCYAEVPPTIYSNTFTVYTNDNATLHVVKGCKEDYSDANYWEYFLNITDDLTADVEDIMVDTDNTPAEYYDLNGRRVEHPTRGIYIVKQGDKVTKVVL